jgi:hypothetical protein
VNGSSKLAKAKNSSTAAAASAADSDVSASNNCRPDSSKACTAEIAATSRNCCGKESEDCRNKNCQSVKKCLLTPFNAGCCEPLTPHHLVEVHCFTHAGGRKKKLRLDQFKEYNDRQAPCVCVSGSRFKEEHGSMHSILGRAERACMDLKGPRSQLGGKNNEWTYAKAKEATFKAFQKTFPNAGPDGKGCSRACLEAQLDSYHNKIGVDDHTPLRADRSPLSAKQKEESADEEEKEREAAATPASSSSTPRKRRKV